MTTHRSNLDLVSAGPAKTPQHCRSSRLIGQSAGERILLLGLDFGSTTSSALVAQASIMSNTATGQMEFGQIRITYRSQVVFTPFLNHQIDTLQVEQLIDGWLAQCGLQPEDFFSGGVIITGLAARRENAAALAEIIQRRIGEVLIATADDPGLESWLAFMGSCSALSRLHAQTPILNLDIGGGTTNPALGLHGNVLSTGCYFIGARHFQFVPGSYKITALTEDAQALLAMLGIRRQVGDLLQPHDISHLVNWYIQALEAIVEGNQGVFQALPDCVQMPLTMPALSQPPALTFSGGVGELVYRLAAGHPLPDTTYYGDLGIDLARAIVASPTLSRSLRSIVPENQGRATVYGLTLHSTEVSGATLYLQRPDILPLRHLPVIAQIDESADENIWCSVLQRLSSHSHGACIQIVPDAHFGLDSVRGLGQRIAAALRRVPPPPELPLVLLFSHNAGKTLGSYASEWGRLPVTLAVIDEVSVRKASFVNIGQPYKQIIPIAFYGMQ